MSLLHKKILISCASFIILVFLCYGAYPREYVSVLGVQQLPITVILDAGHGGEDGGAQASDGTKESDLNLQIALRANDLSALVGLRPMLTRNQDVSLHDSSASSVSQKKASDLRNRVKMINKIDNGFLVSIHQNHFPQGKYHGAQIFYSADERSKTVAQTIQLDMRQTMDPGNKRREKPCQGVYLIDHVSCPAVLVECGFLSNEAELRKLQDAGYQKKIILSVLRTIAQKGNGVFDSEI